MLDSALRSPLHLAVTQDQPDALRLLARHGDRVDCAQLSEHGRNALHIAAVLNRAECARVLVSRRSGIALISSGMVQHSVAFLSFFISQLMAGI